MTKFYMNVKYAGANGVKKSRTNRYYLGDIDAASFDLEAVEAKSRGDAFAAALQTVMECTIIETTISWENFTAPNANTGNTYESAALVVFLETEQDKTAVMNIPGAALGIFQTATGVGRDIVDVADADLQAFLAVAAANIRISDDEVIDVAQGTGGLQSGRRISKPVKRS